MTDKQKAGEGARKAAEECCDYFDGIARTQPREKVIEGLAAIITRHCSAALDARAQAIEEAAKVIDNARAYADKYDGIIQRGHYLTQLRVLAAAIRALQSGKQGGTG